MAGLAYSLIDARASLARETEEIGAKNEEINEVHSVLLRVVGERDGLAATVESLRAERDGLEATVESLHSERETLQAEREATVATLQAEREATVATLQAERDGLEATVESLHSERDGLKASYSALSEENSGVKTTLQTLEAEKRGLEMQVEEFKLAHESVTNLEARAQGLRAVLAGLEEDRKTLQVRSREMFPTCTGSMEPKITCLDTVVVLQNFFPEDIAVDAVISYYPPNQTEAVDSPAVLHRVTEIKIEDGVHYFWPKGDALEEADGHWIPEGNVLGYAIELRQGTRPENSALRERVNGAREAYLSGREKMLEARDQYDQTVSRHCGSLEDASSCSTSLENLTEINAAYDAFSEAWDQYVNAVCQYDAAYYQGLHESEPLTSQAFDPYVAPSLCSQSS